jgi:hypothetical protein
LSFIFALWLPITKNNKKEAGHPPCPAFGMMFAMSFSVVSGFGIATFLR